MYRSYFSKEIIIFQAQPRSSSRWRRTGPSTSRRRRWRRSWRSTSSSASTPSGWYHHHYYQLPLRTLTWFKKEFNNSCCLVLFSSLLVTYNFFKKIVKIFNCQSRRRWKWFQEQHVLKYCSRRNQLYRAHVTSKTRSRKWCVVISDHLTVNTMADSDIHDESLLSTSIKSGRQAVSLVSEPVNSPTMPM